MANLVNEYNGFRYTTSIDKLRKLRKRIRVIPGGTSAGKTYGILPILIDTAIRTPKLEISVVSETIPHLRKGAMKDFLKILVATNRYNSRQWNRSIFQYTFKNGSYIEFFSADNEGKVRGARRTHLYVNEANNVDWEIFNQLQIRTSQQIWLDFNPSNEFWAHSELQESDNTEWLTLTYLDNEGLPDTIRTEIERQKTKGFFDLTAKDLFSNENIKNSYWANWWRVYGLGMLGSLENVIFKDWKIIEQLPPHARCMGYGIDFGFTNDPTTCVGLWYADGEYIYDEVIYQKGLSNSEIAFKLRENNVHGIIVADCAEPKSIAEINKYGFSIQPCEKGADSVVFGIQTMQEIPIKVTARSVNMIKELRSYQWQKDRTGKTLNIPQGGNDHCIDSARYITTKVVTRKNKSGRIIYSF